MSIVSYYENLTLRSDIRQEVSSKQSVFGSSFNYQKDVKGHKGCVNAIEFSPDEELVVSGGDDLRTLVWRTSDLLLDYVPKPCATMKAQHLSNIFANRFDMTGTKLYSGGNDNDVIRHDVETTEMLNKFSFGGAVYCIASNPVDENVFAVCTEEGRVRFFDCREGKQGVLDILNRGSNMYCGQYSPACGAAFVVAGSRCGVRLYDLRNMKREFLKRRDTKCVCNPHEKSAMYACWNSVGSALAVLSSSRNPVYIDLMDKKKIVLGDDRYKNIHTIKSLDFINDHTVITGSDDFKLYAWKVVNTATIENDEEFHSAKESNDEFIVAHRNEVYEVQTIEHADFVLEGHRSIVNQVRFSPMNNMLLTSGVEKILKCWSSLEIPQGYKDPVVRDVGSFRRVGAIAHRILMDVDSDEDDSDDEGDENEMEEDRHMLAYFDTMIMNDRNWNMVMRMPRRPRGRLEIMSSSSDSDDDVDIPLPDVDFDVVFREHGDDAESNGSSSSESSSAGGAAPMETDSDSDSTDSDEHRPDVDETPRPITVYPLDSTSSDSE